MIKRFGILLPGRVLAHDHARGLPATYAHRQSAARAMIRSMPDWLASMARVVAVNYYSADEDKAGNGLPTFEVHA